MAGRATGSDASFALFRSFIRSHPPVLCPSTTEKMKINSPQCSLISM